MTHQHQKHHADDSNPQLNFRVYIEFSIFQIFKIIIHIVTILCVLRVSKYKFFSRKPPIYPTIWY